MPKNLFGQGMTEYIIAIKKLLQLPQSPFLVLWAILLKTNKVIAAELGGDQAGATTAKEAYDQQLQQLAESWRHNYALI